MPNIREYTNKIDAPVADTRAARGAAAAGDAAARAGAAWGGAYSSIGNQIGSTIQRVGNEYQDRTDAHEASKLAADMATASSDLTVQWNKIAKSTDPNDIEQAAQDFHEKVVNPLMEKIGGDLSSETAKNMFMRSSAALKGGLFEKTSADASQLAGVASVSNALTVSNQLSNTLKNDPTSFGMAVEISRMAVQSMVKAHNLPVEKAVEMNSKFEKGYAESAALGMIDRNPEQAKKDIGDGRFEKYLDASDISRLQAHAQTAINAQTEQQRAAAAEQRRQEKQQFANVTNAITAQTVNPETGQLQVPPDFFKNVMQLRNLPGADDSTLRAMVDYGRAVTNDLEKGTPVVTDPHTYEDFRARAFLAETDPRKLSTAEVLQARADHRLSDKDYTFWNSAVNELSKDEAKSAPQKDFNKFITSYKGYITGSSFLKVDAYGDQKYYEWASRAQQMHDQMKSQGVAEPDIRKAIVAVLPQYQVSKDTALQSFTLKATTGLKPLPAGGTVLKRNPGESATDFLKRSGG